MTGIADDIIVYGYKSDHSDHDENLHAVMQRARETGLKFNIEKCQIRCESIPFFGHVVGADGLRPDQKKVEAIRSMDPSNNVADLRTFLEHDIAVDRIKKAITSPKSLEYFNSSEPVTIQVDASQRGIGAVLLQDKGPVEFASKLLTETETRYSNIEREMLAVLFGFEKFHYYVYGRPVVIHTDHKPLEAIFKKDLANARLAFHE
ncbi:Hypothetical predicted protein [Paramuricea clavata]|uniref:Uncharacterized protein n=1 Tax=Paramuricea clavata TaxID=317549 RepID=A0A6S7KAN8_PARCT|nr:Hypothetical predicted protein [Paramuricea clavata]